MFQWKSEKQKMEICYNDQLCIFCFIIKVWTIWKGSLSTKEGKCVESSAKQKSDNTKYSMLSKRETWSPEQCAQFQNLENSQSSYIIWGNYLLTLLNSCSDSYLSLGSLKTAQWTCKFCITLSSTLISVKYTSSFSYYNLKCWFTHWSIISCQCKLILQTSTCQSIWQKINMYLKVKPFHTEIPLNPLQPVKS